MSLCQDALSQHQQGDMWPFIILARLLNESKESGKWEHVCSQQIASTLPSRAL